MSTTELTHQIASELESLQAALVRNDAEAIERSASSVRMMLEEFANALRNGKCSFSVDWENVADAARCCSAVLRRARATLIAMRNLHDIFSPEHTYRVRG